MDEPTPRDRLHENATEIASIFVTGIWLAALVTGQSWWLGALLFGYVVVVPLVALLFEDEDDQKAWWDDGWWDWWGEVETEPNQETQNRQGPPTERETETNRADALSTLRTRYARGELTDEQFERKLERLLETETLEDLEDRKQRERDLDR